MKARKKKWKHARHVKEIDARKAHEKIKVPNPFYVTALFRYPPFLMFPVTWNGLKHVKEWGYVRYE